MDKGWGSECCFLCVRIDHSVPLGEKLFVVGQNKIFFLTVVKILLIPSMSKLVIFQGAKLGNNPRTRWALG